MQRRRKLQTLTLLGFFFSAIAPHLQAAPPPATYRIAGVVVDSVTGQPLEGAEVTIAPVTALEDAQTFLTSSDGLFVFADLPRGKYRLMGRRRGYATQTFHQHEGYSTAIATGPGLDSEHIRFPLAPSSVITGIVTDDWGDPVRDAKVLLFQQNLFDGSRALRNISQTTTDDQGGYRFTHLLSGTYAVAVYAHPWYAQSQMQGQYSFHFLGRVDLNSSENAVVYDGPQPIPAATNDPLFDVVYPVTFFPNVTSLEGASRLSLHPGATVTADFQLRAVPSVHLRVRAPVQPPTPVIVTSESTDSGGNAQETSSTTSEIESSPDVSLALKIGETYTDQIEPTRKQIAPGIVELSGIPPGQFEVNIGMIGSILGLQEDSIVSHGKALNVSGDAEVDLSAQGDSGAVSGVVLSSVFSETLAMSLMRSAPENQSNVMLGLRSLKTGESYSTTVSSQGKFSFAASSLPAGSYEVEFPDQGGLRVSSLEATGGTVSDRTVDIPAGHPVNVVVHAVEANCTLSGIAMKNGKPFAGAMILLIPQDPRRGTSIYHRDQSDSDGSFTMSPLFPGRYTLLAIENGWDLEWADPAVLFQYLPAGKPVTLASGASVTLNAKVQ